jgi:excisionase family DNA binding protein
MRYLFQFRNCSDRALIVISQLLLRRNVEENFVLGGAPANASAAGKAQMVFGDVPRRPQRDRLEFLTIPDVAERLRVSTRTVRRWIADDNLIAHRIGGLVRISESDLRAFLALRRDS